MAGLLDALSRMKLVDDVTSSKDEAPPVYLMDEIVGIVRLDAEASQQIAEMIVRRISYKSPVIKYKALRLIKHLCNKGCGHFQRAMQRSSNVIRDLVHFKGEQDPYKGDVPNQRVRDMAQEAVEVLFNALPQAPPPAANIQGRIQGFGSSTGPTAAAPTSSHGSNSGSAASNGTGGRVMVGFGSDSAYKPAGAGSGAPGPGAGAAAVREAGAAIRDLGSNVGSFLRNTFAGETPERAGYLTASPNATAAYSYGHPDSGRQSASHSRSASGGSATSALYSGNSAAAAAAQLSSLSGRGGSGAAGAGRPVLTPASESQVVDNICTPGGMRVAPDAADLRQFVENVSNLDGLRVAELLREKMTSGSWQSLLRALTALEALLQQGMTVSCGEVAVMFQSDPEPVRNALNHSQPLVRERAAAVWPLLVNEAAPDIQLVTALQQQGAASAASGKAGGGTAAANNVVDLLGDDLLGPSPLPANGAAQAAATSDMFGGLSLTADGPHAPTSQAATNGYSSAHTPGSSLTGLPAAATAQVATTASYAATSAPSPKAPPAAAPAKQGQAVLDDFFASIGTPSVSPAATHTPANLLAQPARVNASSAPHSSGAGAQRQQQQQDWSAPSTGFSSTAYPHAAGVNGVAQANSAALADPFALMTAAPTPPTLQAAYQQPGQHAALQQQQQPQRTAQAAFTGFDLPDVLPPVPQPAAPSAVWMGNGFATGAPLSNFSHASLRGQLLPHPITPTLNLGSGMPHTTNPATFSAPLTSGATAAPAFSLGGVGPSSAVFGGSAFSLAHSGPAASSGKASWQPAPNTMRGPGGQPPVSTATSGGADMFDFVKDAIKKL